MEKVYLAPRWATACCRISRKESIGTRCTIAALSTVRALVSILRKEYLATRFTPNNSMTSAISPYSVKISETRVSLVISII